MKTTAKVFSTEVNGTFTQIKAHKKANAVKRFQEMDERIKAKNVYVLDVKNSHQEPID